MSTTTGNRVGGGSGLKRRDRTQCALAPGEDSFSLSGPLPAPEPPKRPNPTLHPYPSHLNRPFSNPKTQTQSPAPSPTPPACPSPARLPP
ncbi:hypothetical protein M427DRAFT_57213 [Gonapodya prolifera JEL478]|uniref:Uncharacterized protein n=1 Tax=Gonapodya prolifera (strain JEL478) TaxID=1344416 RepID=A0A139AED5_GONPJ|nr:hypothetical protein M427DRAFT_57213 [Gonapodya prolifera JEL478]|eukprot:KXS14805.1 hypothetical protein M427DRAFT_57213 [Gonapodya prolifera JEL478]